MAIFCSNCGVSLPDGVAFCDACGTPVRRQAQVGSPVAAPNYSGGPQHSAAGSAGSVACPVCGTAALPGEAFCDNCGAALLSPASGAYSPPPASPPVPQYSQASLDGYAQPQPQFGQRTASLVVTSPAPPATLSVPTRSELIVGRSDPQSNSYPDVDLGPYGGLDLGVSRRHFRLARTGDQFYVEDLGSVNGTVINGQRIPSHTLHPLRPGDRIALGKMELSFELV